MTYNEQFFDASLRHQIDVLRLGSGVTRKVNAILDETRADLRKQVEKRLAKGTALDSAGMKRLAELERAIDQIRSGAWNDVTQEWTRTALDVATEEPLFVSGVLRSILPVQLDLVMPAAATLRALATKRPFQGRLLKEWAESASRADLARIKQQIRIGMVQGESARDIAARVFGVKGAMALTRHQAEAVTRTVINGVSNAAQQEFLSENADLLEGEVFVATLDARTTLVCAGQDGKMYPVGKGPIPPLHVNCRSIRVGTIDGQVVGERPFKAGTEQQMLREYGEQYGLKGLKSRDDLPRGHKSSFDAFSRKRMRELTGQVPAHTSYQEWLSKQPPDIQDDILGPTRGKLFRDGGLPLDKFTSREGDELTIDQLRERNRSAFERAGLITRFRAVEEVKTVGDVSVAQRDAAERTIARLAPRGVPPLKLLEMHDKRAFEVAAFGSAVFADGYYSHAVARIRAATRLPVYARPIDHANWTISDTARTPIEALENLIAHEYGHHVHIASMARVDQVILDAYAEAVPKQAALRARGIDFRDVNDPEGAPSRYGTANHLEFWAESFAAYHFHRDWLRAQKPVAFRMVETVLDSLNK